MTLLFAKKSHFSETSLQIVMSSKRGTIINIIFCVTVYAKIMKNEAKILISRNKTSNTSRCAIEHPFNF